MFRENYGSHDYLSDLFKEVRLAKGDEDSSKYCVLVHAGVREDIQSDILVPREYVESLLTTYRGSNPMCEPLLNMLARDKMSHDVEESLLKSTGLRTAVNNMSMANIQEGLESVEQETEEETVAQVEEKVTPAKEMPHEDSPEELPEPGTATETVHEDLEVTDEGGREDPIRDLPAETASVEELPEQGIEELPDVGNVESGMVAPKTEEKSEGANEQVEQGEEATDEEPHGFEDLETLPEVGGSIEQGEEHGECCQSEHNFDFAGFGNVGTFDEETADKDQIDFGANISEVFPEDHEDTLGDETTISMTGSADDYADGLEDIEQNSTEHVVGAAESKQEEPKMSSTEEITEQDGLAQKEQTIEEHAVVEEPKQEELKLAEESEVGEEPAQEEQAEEPAVVKEETKPAEGPAVVKEEMKPAEEPVTFESIPEVIKSMAKTLYLMGSHASEQADAGQFKVNHFASIVTSMLESITIPVLEVITADEKKMMVNDLTTINSFIDSSDDDYPVDITLNLSARFFEKIYKVAAGHGFEYPVEVQYTIVTLVESLKQLLA